MSTGGKYCSKTKLSVLVHLPLDLQCLPICLSNSVCFCLQYVSIYQCNYKSIYISNNLIVYTCVYQSIYLTHIIRCLHGSWPIFGTVWPMAPPGRPTVTDGPLAALQIPQILGLGRRGDMQYKTIG